MLEELECTPQDAQKIKKGAGTEQDLPLHSHQKK